MSKQKVIVILGPTATGKSNLAVQIALRLSGGQAKKTHWLNQSKGLAARTSHREVLGEVISADSRQVYAGLDIGTGKITKEEMKGVEHHLLDIVSPKKKFTVAQYKELAEKKIKEILNRGNVPIICGGTGFYIDAMTKGIIFPEVLPNKKLRNILEKKTTENLFKMLEKLDPRRAKDIKKNNEQNNKVRLIRAIEIIKAIGRVPKIKQIKSNYEFIKIGLFVPKEILKEKIEKRVSKMFDDGLLNEIKKLKKIGISTKRFQSLGFEYFNPTKEKVISQTLKYVKRQITWFKRDKDIIWFDASKKNLEKEVLTQIKKEY